MSGSKAVKPASVLLICDSYPPVMGGSEIEAQRVSSALIRRGHRVLVLCSGGPPMPPVRDWTDPAGVPVRILTRSSRGRWKDILFAFRVAWNIWKERRNYEIVYFLMQGLHLASGLLAARALGKPILAKISGSGVISMMRGSLLGRLELRWIHTWARRLLVLNEGMIVEALDAGFVRDRITWMPNPVDTDEFRPAVPGEAANLRRQFALPAGAKIVTYVGRLSPEKGLPLLLRSFGLAARSVPDALLLLVGDGPMLAELKALAARHGLTAEQIRFAGRVNAPEVPSWLRVSDLFALTSPNEGFPCALSEAMSAGLPAVVTAIPGNVQLIASGVEGVAVQLNDEAATAAALVGLLNDQAARQRMGQLARQRIIDNYSVVTVAERYEKLFDQIRVPGESQLTRPGRS